jgi:polar amino acid transport system substrate-binding protein
MPGKRFVFCLCASIALLLAACVPPESDVQDVIPYDRDTTMGRLQRRGHMTVALPGDLAPFSSIGADGEPEGFVAELASEVVDALGVEAEYVEAFGDEALELVREGEADLAFPIVGITETLARQNNLSDPYWVAHKRLLVRATSEVQSAKDLEGRSGEAVCQFEEERTRTDISEILPAVPSSDVSDFRQCVDQLENGGQAVTAPDIYLMVLANELDDYEIRGEQLSTAGYAAALPVEATDMADFVNTVLFDAKSEGRWRGYYEEWLAPVANLEGANAPDLGLEEAATLWPRDLE